MLSALDTAGWLLSQNAKRVVQDEGELMSVGRLMKLLYLAQTAHVAATGAPLFPEDIERWKYGPAIREVYRTFKACRSGIDRWDAPREEPPQQTREILNAFAEHFLCMPSWELTSLINQEMDDEGVAVNSFADIERGAEWFAEHHANACGLGEPSCDSAPQENTYHSLED